MFGLSLGHLLVLLLIVLLLFGRNKIPALMGDIGKGIHSLREGLKGESTTTTTSATKPTTPPTIDQPKQ